VAVIERLPRGRALVVKLAFLELSWTVPSVVLPFVNVTVPLTAEAVGLETVPMKVTVSPRMDVFVMKGGVIYKNEVRPHSRTHFSEPLSESPLGVVGRGRKGGRRSHAREPNLRGDPRWWAEDRALPLRAMARRSLADVGDQDERRVASGAALDLFCSTKPRSLKGGRRETDRSVLMSNPKS
jgi:hypothetical protein